MRYFALALLSASLVPVSALAGDGHKDNPKKQHHSKEGRSKGKQSPCIKEAAHDYNEAVGNAKAVYQAAVGPLKERANEPDVKEQIHQLHESFTQHLTAAKDDYHQAVQACKAAAAPRGGAHH